MKEFFKIISFAGLIITVQSCSPNGTPIVRLGTPHFVPQSQPDSVIETGIGQDPSTGGIFLQWSTAPGASGYKLFRSDSTDATGNPVNFSIAADINASTSLNDTSTVDANGISTGVRYYYYSRAYTADGSLSSPSDTINYALLVRPSLDYPTPNAVVSSTGMHFTWIDRTGGGYTVIRVKDIIIIPAEYIWVTPRFQKYGGSESLEGFNFDSTASASLISGHSYQWRVDRFNEDGTGRPYEGSRSIWQTFTVK